VTRWWPAVRLVAAREIRQVLRGKTFWVVSGLLLAGSTAAMILPEVLEDDSTPSYEVAVVDGSPSLDVVLQQAVAAIDGKLDVSTAPDVAVARRQVSDDVVDLAVVAGADPQILVQAGESEQLVGAVRQALGTDALARGLTDAGLPEAEVQALLETPPAQVVELDTERADRRGAAFGLSLAMYLLLLMLMMSVANGTAVEKANRISEVLLAIVRPGSLLFGKVLGVGLTGVATVLCGAGPLIVKFAVGGDLPDGFGGALVGGAVWFVLGTALYLVLAGALGALVERQEEAGTVTAPLNMLLVATYIVGGSAPESAIAGVLAYIPLTSPMVMPSRIAVGVASGMEMAVSAALSLAAIVVVARVGSTVYKRAIVRTGRRLKLREVLQSA
jgi:ABC-2 type transport system permease protein